MASTTRTSLAGRAAKAAGKAAGKVIPRRSATSSAPEPGTPAAPAKRTAAKKTTAEKAPAKKSPAKKAPAKKAPARKAPARKTAAEKAPAKRSPAKKTAAKKTAAKKTPAPRTPVKKTAPAAPSAPVAKKATAVKKATEKAAEKPAEKAPAETAAVQKSAAKKAPAKKAPAAKAPAKTPAASAAAARKAPRSALVVKEGEEAWTKAELDEVLAELHEQRGHSHEIIAQQEAELSGLMRDAGDGAGHDQADMGATSFERDHELTVLNSERDKLAQIDRALGRIDDGSYGVCESCGNPIGKMRLMAFPRATLCMTCKQREERR